MIKVPFLDFSGRNQYVRDEAISAFEEFIDGKWYVLGRYTDRFESDYARYNNTKHAIGVSTGLDALHLALTALGVGKGDEVIVPSNTYIATVLAITHVGAVPVFVEPRIETYNIDPGLIRQAISPKTRAIMPVHLYGQACEMDAIMNIARKHELVVVEDNAQGHGACYAGNMTGSIGDANAVSFYPTKNIGALGEAGAVTTNSDEVAGMIRTLRNYGSSRRYYNDYESGNYRIDEYEAAFLSIALGHYDVWMLERERIAQRYLAGLKGVGDLILPEVADRATHVYHLFIIRTSRRDKLQAYLKIRGIDTVVHYPLPPHLQACYRTLGYGVGDYPIAEEIATTALSIPLYIGMANSTVDYVVECIRDYYG